MASKSIASPALLLLAMVLVLEASAHAHLLEPSTPLAPAPSQDLCPNGFKDIQALETAARALVDKVLVTFLPNTQRILDTILAKLGLLYPELAICVCTNNLGPGPQIKCLGGNLRV